MNRNTDPVISATRVTTYPRVNLLFVLLFVLAGAVVGFGFKVATQPAYQATTTLLVGDVTQDPGFSKSDVDASRELAATYGTLIRAQPVLGPVVQTLGLPITWEELKNRIHVAVGINGSQLVSVTVSGATPEEATTLAAAVADQVIAISPSSLAEPSSPTSTFALVRMDALQKSINAEQARLDAAQAKLPSAPLARQPRIRSRISSAQSLILRLQTNYVAFAALVSSGGWPNVIQVIQPAEADSAPVRPNMRADVLIGAAAGLVLGLIVATFLIGRWNRRQRQLVAERTRGSGGAGTPDRVDQSRVDVSVGERDPWLREMNDPDNLPEKA